MVVIFTAGIPKSTHRSFVDCQTCVTKGERKNWALGGRGEGGGEEEEEEEEEHIRGWGEGGGGGWMMGSGGLGFTCRCDTDHRK
jgi:hypothetical protein